MKDIKPILQSLGLLESEIKTYMAALGHGPGTVIQLTKSTRLSRQAVYVAIESLIARGIMASVMVEKKKLFAAEHPEKLLAYARRREVEMKEKISELERVVPELELSLGGEKPIVRMFEGKEGVRNILADMQSAQSKQIDEISDIEAVRATFMPGELKPLKESVIKAKSCVRGIYFGGEPVEALGVLSGEKNDECALRYLPAEMGRFKANIAVYGNKIMFVTFEGKMYSVIMENKAIADAMRKLFSLAHKEVARLEVKE
ncbi:MAG: helix-turn-helix domain-containing protein [bacterium]